MKKLFLLIVACILVNFAYCQSIGIEDSNFPLEQKINALNSAQYLAVRPYFEEAYRLYPSIPQGILEATAFTYSRFCHLNPDTTELESNCIPPTYGVMGLTLDGKGFFRENLKYVSELSGVSIEEIVQSSRSNILAYAAAYATLQSRKGVNSSLSEQYIILNALSELPQQRNQVLQFAVESNLYAIYKILEDSTFCRLIGISRPRVDYDRIFGTWLPRLQSATVVVSDDNLSFPENQDTVANGESRSLLQNRTTDYPGAIWNEAGVCNYSSRNGGIVSSITIHYTAGTYAGSIAWFQDCTYNGVGAQASAHYVIRSIDGQITQMVRESEKAWHVRSANPYTIGIEHEAYGDIQSFFTPAMYQASADLTRNICDRYSTISPLRMFYRDTLDDGTALNVGLHDLGGENACIKIRGHQHYPDQSHTDPGPYWNWNYYYKLVNDDTPVTVAHDATGTFTDSGGDDGNYGDDERQLFLISVPDAEQITLTFSEFELEDDYDFMWIYDGNSVFAPLIGRWNTQSPGTIISAGNEMLIEFRSDCGTNDVGWQAQWSADIPIQDNPPTTTIDFDENQWITSNFNLNFQDDDDHAVAYRFYQVMGNDGRRWTANNYRGFLCDNFDDLNPYYWQSSNGSWGIRDHQLQQTSLSSANISVQISGDLSDAYLYDFYASFLPASASNAQMDIFFHSDRQVLNNRGNAYSVSVSPSDRTICFYKITNGVKTLVYSIPDVYTQIGTNYFYRILHNRRTGDILFFRDHVLLGQWLDSYALTTRSQYFSFQTEQAHISIDNLRAYRSREDAVQITVGASLTNDVMNQALAGTAKTKIKSIVIDDAMQFSTLAEKSVKVDFTPPNMSRVVNDGTGSDIDVLTENIVSANWAQATDPHSGILQYEYYLSPSPYSEMNSEINLWTNIGLQTAVSNRMRLLDNHNYYFRVRAKNRAGLTSAFAQSDGFIYHSENHLTSRERFSKCSIRIYPIPAVDEIYLVITPDDYLTQEQVGNRQFSTTLYDIYGKKLLTASLNFEINTLNISALNAGVYLLQIFENGQMISCKKIIKQ